MFFKSQGTTQYKINNDVYEMTDLSNVSVLVNLNRSLLQGISVNSRSPEQIAYDMYGDATLYWTILYINDIVDPFTEWYMSESQIYDYCVRKYGEEKMNQTRYYKNIKTNEVIVGDDALIYKEIESQKKVLPEYVTAITNYMHEQIKNTKRMNIRVIPKAYISRFVDDYKNALKG